MCKKFFVLFLTLMITLSHAGCSAPFSDKDMDVYEKIHNHYNKMESFSSDLDLTVFSNKTENRYFVSQKYKSPDKFFTRATDENATFSVTTITNGKKTKTSADGSEYFLTVPSEEYLSLLFLNNFFKAYYMSEETSLTVDSSLVKNDKTVLTVTASENDLCIGTISLSLDNKTLSPLTLTAFDKDGNKLLFAKYENFKFNEKNDDSVFNID